MTNFLKSLLIEVSKTLITAVIAVSVSVYIGGKIEGLTNLFRTVNVTLERFEALVDVGPEGIRNVATALGEGAEEAGEGIGGGTATAIRKAQEAWIRRGDGDATDGEPPE